MIKIVQNPFSNVLQKNNSFLSQIKNALLIILLVGFTYQAKAQVSAYTFSGSGTGQTYTPLANTDSNVFSPAPTTSSIT